MGAGASAEGGQAVGWQSKPSTGGRDAAAGSVWAEAADGEGTVQGKATTSQCDMTGEAAGVLGGKGIPCRRSWGGAGVQRRGVGVGVLGAWAAARCKSNEDEANRTR